MFRTWTIAIILMLGTSFAASGMDHVAHAAHGVHAAHVAHGMHTDGMQMADVMDAAQPMAADHDACVAEAHQEGSMPAHGTCLGCCPDDSGASDALTVDRRMAGPDATIHVGSTALPNDLLKDDVSPRGLVFSVFRAPTVLRL